MGEACDGKPVTGSQGEEAGVGAPPGSSSRTADRASTLSAQRKLGELDRRADRGLSVQWLCSQVVGLQMSARDPRRRKASRRRRRHAFDEAGRRQSLATAHVSGSLKQGHRDRGRQKPSCTLDVGRERPRREARRVRVSIEPSPRTRGVRGRPRGDPRRSGSCGEVEAGGSPSSEAPPDVAGRRALGVSRGLKAGDRRQADRGEVERPRGVRRARSGIGQLAGCSCRASVAEVGETRLSRRAGACRGNPGRAGAGG